MCDFSLYSGPIYQKLGTALFGDYNTNVKSGTFGTSREDYTEPMIPCREKEAHSFQEEILRRENRELKAKCEKLAVFLRCKDAQLPNRLGEKHEQAPKEHVSHNNTICCGDLDMNRYQCDLDEFRAIVTRLQECSSERTELEVARDECMITVAELNCSRKEQDERMNKMIRSNKQLVDTVMKYRSSVCDCECRLLVLSTEEEELRKQTSDLIEQVKQLKGQLAEERQINNDLTASLCSAEAAAADSASSLRSISSNHISISNRQQALIEELRAWIHRLEGLKQIETTAAAASSSAPACASPLEVPLPDRCGELEEECATHPAKKLRTEGPSASLSTDAAHVGNLQMPSHAQSLAQPSGSDAGTVQKKVVAPAVHSTGTAGSEPKAPRVQARAASASGSCPQCGEAAFGLMVSCGKCGACFHSFCARKVRMRVASATGASADPQHFVCSDCAATV